MRRCIVWQNNPTKTCNVLFLSSESVKETNYSTPSNGFHTLDTREIDINICDGKDGRDVVRGYDLSLSLSRSLPLTLPLSLSRLLALLVKKFHIFTCPFLHTCE